MNTFECLVAKLPNLHQELISGLRSIPEGWATTPVYADKRPYRKNWQSEAPVTKVLIERDIRNGKAKGFGLRTGAISGGIVAIDADGHAAHDKILELSGGEPLPETVAFTSNKPGRCQYLFYIPQDYWKVITTKRVNTGIKGDDGKEQQLELRWDGCQSVLPPSVHPETGFYRWRKSPSEVAIAPCPMWIIEQMLVEPESEVERPDQIQLPVDAVIPLVTCLTHRSRDMLSSSSAAPDKGRNNSGIELARDLIGTANYLDSLGQRYEGNPEHLFFDWCRACGLDSDKPKGQPNTIWKSANKNPAPGSSDDGVKTCIQHYYWNNHLKASGRSFGGGIGGRGGNRRGNGGSGGSGGLKAVSLYERVEEVLNRELPDSQQIEALIKLAQNEGVTRSDVESIAKEILAEKERWADLNQDSPQFKKLVSFREEDLNLSEVFPTTLAKAFLTKAHSSRLDPIRLVQNLLPACGAVLGASVSVVAKRGATERDHWYEHPIFWTVDVSAPSSGKSDAQRACFDPLKEMEKEAFKRVDKDKRRLAVIDAKWKSLCEEEREEKRGTDADPEFFKSEYIDKVRRYLWDEATIEALFRLISEQAPGAGTAWVKDELEALFKGLDQHKSGNKGNALQQLLSSWSGPLWGTIDRVDKTKSFRMSGQTLNISGTIQPDVFINRVNVRDDPDGLISRLLPAMSKLPEGFSTWSDVRVDLFDCIADLLKGLEQMGGTCEFSSQAHKLWISQWEKLRRGYETYLESNPAFAYFLGKQCSYVPRLALLLHCIEHHYAPKTDFTHIGLDTLEKAIILSDYYCGQFRLLQAASFTKDEFPLEGLLFKVWEKVKALGKMAARDICQFARRYKWHGKKITAGTALEILATIRDAGYGILQGKTLYFKSPDNPPPPPPLVGNVDQMLINDQHAQSQEESGFQGFVDQVDQHPDKNLENESTGVAASGFSFTPPNDQPDQQMAEIAMNQDLDDVDQVSTIDQHEQQMSKTDSGTTLDAIAPVNSTNIGEAEVLVEKQPLIAQQEPSTSLDQVNIPSPVVEDWQVGETVIVQTDIPSLKNFEGRTGTVETVCDLTALCLVKFISEGLQQVLQQIPSRNLRRSQKKVVTTAPHSSPKLGDRIEHKNFVGVLAARNESGWFVNWTSPASIRKIYGEPPALVQDGEFQLLD